MSFLDKLKSRMIEVADDAAERMKEFAATPEEYERRIAICIECPRIIKITKTCKECGCFMTAKARLDGAECPLKKW